MTTMIIMNNSSLTLQTEKKVVKYNIEIAEPTNKATEFEKQRQKPKPNLIPRSELKFLYVILSDQKKFDTVVGKFIDAIDRLDVQKQKQTEPQKKAMEDAAVT